MNSNLTTSANIISYKDILLRKLYYSVICCVFSQIVILQLYVFIANFNIFHPLQWFSSATATVTSISTWLYIVPFLVIILAQAVICAKDYVFKRTYCSTRFQKFFSVFSIHNLVLLMLHIAIGAILVWLYLSLGQSQYQSLSRECSNIKQKRCLNKGSIFLIFSGLWTGFYFFVNVYLVEKRLTFPVVHQRKLLQFKVEVVSLIKNSLYKSLWPSFLYLIIDFLAGKAIIDRIIAVFGLSQDNRNDGFEIYLYLVIFTAFYYFCMNLMMFFFNLHLTEPIEFPLVKHNDSFTLQDSINMTDLPIIQNLACLDLYLLAHWSKMRRMAFYSLSQPGGHPHNWNSLIENVLKLLADYTEVLNKSTDGTAEKMPQNQIPVVKPCFQSPDKFINLRNMSMHCTPTELLDVELTHNPLPGISLPEKILNDLKTKIWNFWTVVKILTGINFLFGELPQASIQKCLANGQLIIWTTQGISDIACASLTEDRFGIVQKDLPVLITTLVGLKQSLDKLNKVPALTRKIAGFNDFNCKMKNALNLAVKRSLLNICRTFTPYLNELALNKDIMQQLQNIITRS